MLNSRQRAQLRAMANTMDTIFQVGKSGGGDALNKQVDEALEARELIKMRILESAPDSVRDTAEQIASAVKADVVQVIGSRFVLYRESKDNKKIILVK